MAEITETKHAQGCQAENQEQAVQEALPAIDHIIDSMKKTKGALIPVLQQTQNLLGYLPEEALQHISERMDIPYSEVTGVVTFYSFFSTVPRGKHIVRVCLGTACYVRGGKQVLEAISRDLGIEVGYTTEDKLFSLEVGRCFGACSLAPVVMVDDTVHQRIRPDKVSDLLSMYREQEDQEDTHG